MTLTSSNPSVGTAAAVPHLTIRPSSGWAALDLRELWRFRDLLFTLAGRDLKLRYRQTFLGVAWVLLQPLFAAAVFTAVFGVVAKLSTTFLMSFAGMAVWNLFSTTMSKSSTSLVGNAQLVSKVYFPRLVLPLSAAVSSLVDFAITLVVLAVLMAFRGVAPGPALFALPLWVALAGIMGLALGLYASSLTVSYRDVQYLLPVLMQLMLLASPVGYEVPAEPRWFHVALMLNPMTGAIEAFRWSLLGTPAHWWAVAYSAAFATIAFVSGALAFKRMERRFADVI